MQGEQTRVVRAQSRDIKVGAWLAKAVATAYPRCSQGQSRGGGDSHDATARLPHCGALQKG